MERTSRYIMLVRADGLSSGDILKAFTRRLRDIPASLRRTITYDRGSEMAQHKTLARRLRFFCDAYSAWQRGSNDNANGTIREFLPKGLDLSPFTDKNLRDGRVYPVRRWPVSEAIARVEEAITALKIRENIPLLEGAGQATPTSGWRALS